MFKMELFLKFLILITVPLPVHCEEEYLASKIRAEKIERIRCGYSLTTLWTAELAHSPFAAAPLIADVDADGDLDIIAAPFSESFTVIEAENGKVHHPSAWPAINLDNSVHSSPVQFDVDGDGLLDILFTMSSGELMFYDSNGLLIPDKKYQIPPIYVARDWYQFEVVVDHANMQKYVTTDRQEAAQKPNYIAVDPHVLATPVLADLNNDNRVEELIIPVSFFYEDNDYRVEEKIKHLGGLNVSDMERFLVAGVTVLNLTAMVPIWTKVMDLTRVSAAFPAYNLFSPTVIDIDGKSGEMDVVIGTSAGTLYIFDHKGDLRKGWPVNINSLHGQITVADLSYDGTLKLVTLDIDGNVICFNTDGTKFWESTISGTSSPGSRLFDIDHDKTLDIVIPTNEGDVYALNGINGSVLPGWPIKFGKKLWSNVLITKISTTHTTPDMVVVADDGTINIVSMDLKCRAHFPIDETSLVQVLSHDLVKHSLGLELLVATNDGTVICLGSGGDIAVLDIYDDDKLKQNKRLSQPTETKTINDFSYAVDKPNIYITMFSTMMAEITGDTFAVEYEILHPGYKADTGKNIYTVKVFYGRNFLASSVHDRPGIYAIQVPAWDMPSHGHLTLLMTNQFGQVFQDSYSIKFNKLIIEDLQWMLLAPFVAMVVILLVLHGFPAKDLLPYTFQSKSR